MGRATVTPAILADPGGDVVVFSEAAGEHRGEHDTLGWQDLVPLRHEPEWP